MLYEQRRFKRASVQFEVKWRGDAGASEGQTSDISEGGCFVLTSGQVAPGELIRLEVALPGGDAVTAWGVVVEQWPEIGFSLRFTGLSDADRAHIARIVAHSSNLNGVAFKKWLDGVENVAVKV
ncbi:MAG: PilZ domain-containing protein [Pyrinomonadaceae bacterium]